jgi:predicted nuclease of predicted toxin-antitoxin system
MILLAADENLDNAIVRGLRHRNPLVDIVRVQDIGLSGADDPTVLEWAAAAGRILVTHDGSTIVRYAYERVRRGQLMTGVVVVRLSSRVGQVIDDLIRLTECTEAAEWQGTVQYLPL